MNITNTHEQHTVEESTALQHTLHTTTPWLTVQFISVIQDQLVWEKAQLYLPTQLLYLSGLSYQRMISKHCSPLFHKHIYQINSSPQVHLMHSQYVRAFWTLFAFSWSFIYPHDISNLYVLIFQVPFLNKYCKLFIHSWLSFAFVFIQFAHHMTFYNFNFPSTSPRPVNNSQITWWYTVLRELLTSTPGTCRRGAFGGSSL